MKRLYFALTNHCNRSCAPCSCFSRPERSSFLSLAKFTALLPQNEEYEIQLEGGEPMLHPDWKEMIAVANTSGRCQRMTIGTNGSLLPFVYTDQAENTEPAEAETTRDNRTNNQGQKALLDQARSVENLLGFFRQLPTPFVLKVSINHYLYQEDTKIFAKAILLRQVFEILQAESDYRLIFNVRLRRTASNSDPDSWIRAKMTRLGLSKLANIFYFQRYGFAADDKNLELPFVIENPVDFHLICPFGRDWGQDLVARSEAMKEMP